MRNTVTILLAYLCLTTTLQVSAMDHEYAHEVTANYFSLTTGTLQPSPLYLADSEQDSSSVPESGTLVIPGEDQSKKQKQCLNVCKKWGEDCIINPRTGARTCRRTCKQFGEECF